jgi:aspartyl aminopeptidase
VWGSGAHRQGEFREWLAAQLELEPGEIGWWELCLFDRTPAAVLGADASLLASGRLDNQLSCWAATDAIAGSTAAPAHHQVIALFDHEEVGSESTTGAAGPVLEQVLERISLARGVARGAHLANLARSSCLSADNAHACTPTTPSDTNPATARSSTRARRSRSTRNQRYATSAVTAQAFERACDVAGVPWQVFVSRNNMPCGSTIGPITATRLGIDTVDVGVPQLSMHSARELCGTERPDPPDLRRPPGSREPDTART